MMALRDIICFSQMSEINLKQKELVEWKLHSVNGKNTEVSCMATSKPKILRVRNTMSW